MTETKLAIDIAADISARPEFAKCESPLVLAIVQAALTAHDAARAQPVRPPDGLDIETIAATLDELGTTDGYDEEDLAWAKRQAGLLRTLANSTQQPSAYCLDCQRAGMRNCQNLDECSGATCVTCHRPLNTPARPTSAMHQQLLDTLGATNQSDAMRIIAEHHARELRAQPASVADAMVPVFSWQPIETAPKNNKRPLFLARFNDDGSLQSFDYDASWMSESESWEIPEVYFFWASANGNVEEPTHWAYQPAGFGKIEAALATQENPNG